jgi:hypothetical protein
MATETKKRALGDEDAVDGGQPKMRLRSQAPTTPCKSPLDCGARFSTARAFHKNSDKFNPDTFGREQEEYRLLKGFDTLKVVVGQTFDGLARGKNQQAVINETSGATMDQVLSPADFFFVDPDHAFDGGFSVHSEEGRELALRRGFQEIKFSHLTSLLKIPWRATEAATANLDLPVPSILTLPKKTLPSIYKKEDKTYAEALVRAFEAKFVDIKTMQQPYSPCPLWTDKARKEAAISKDSKFTAWCCAYFAVREIIKGDPKNINHKLTILQELGTESKPSNMKGCWSDLASSIATRYLQLIRNNNSFYSQLKM